MRRTSETTLSLLFLAFGSLSFREGTLVSFLVGNRIQAVSYKTHVS